MHEPLAPASPFARASKPMLRRRAAFALALAPLLGACVSFEEPQPALAEVTTVPAGATCTTDSGEVFTTPAMIPCPDSGVLRFQIALAGHAPRQVELDTARPSARLSTFFLGDLFGALAGVEWERITAPDGRVSLDLVCLEDAPNTPNAPNTTEQLAAGAVELEDVRYVETGLSTTELTSLPSPSISTSMRSPGFE